MAKGEPVKWITVKGRRVPIYEDGSMGGFMEGKKATSKQENDKKSGKKTYRVYFEDGNQKLLEANSEEELDAYLKDNEKKIGKATKKEHAKEYDEKEKSVKSRIANGEYDHSQGKNMDELVSELKKNGLELESADAHDMRNSKSFNDEKVTLYDKDGNEYEGTYNKYMDGGREVVNIKPKKGNAADRAYEGKSGEERIHLQQEVMQVSKDLSKNKSVVTKNKDIADMYKENANPNFNYTVEKQADGSYKISKKGSKSHQGAVNDWNRRVSNAQRDQMKGRTDDNLAAWREQLESNGGPKTADDKISLAALKKEQEERKSIKVGNKEVGIHETRMQRTKMAIANGQNNLKGMPIGDLKELAIDAGVASSKLKGMSADELRKMILSIYKK